MRISSLKDLISKYNFKSTEQEVVNKIKEIIHFTFNNTDDDVEFSPEQVYKFVTYFDLFHENDVIPPWERKTNLERELQRLIAKEILGAENDVSINKEHDIMQIIQILVIDRQENHILIEDYFITLLGKGKRAAYIADGFMMLNQHGLLESCKETWGNTVLSSPLEFTAKLHRGLHILNQRQALTKDTLEILLHHPDYPSELAEGLASLCDALIDFPENRECLIQHAKQAHLLAWGLAKLTKSEICTPENRHILCHHPYGCIADIFCMLHELGMLTDTNKKFVLEQAEHSLFINYLLSDLQRSKTGLFTQENIEAVFRLAENSLVISEWLYKLENQSINTQRNFDKLCKHIKCLHQERVQHVLSEFLTPAVTRSEYLQWVVKLTQQRFDKVIELCEKADKNIEKAAIDVANYLEKLVLAQRTKNPAEISVVKNSYGFYANKKNLDHMPDREQSFNSENRGIPSAAKM